MKRKKVPRAAVVGDSHQTQILYIQILSIFAACSNAHSNRFSWVKKGVWNSMTSFTKAVLDRFEMLKLIENVEMEAIVKFEGFDERQIFWISPELVLEFSDVITYLKRWKVTGVNMFMTFLMRLYNKRRSGNISPENVIRSTYSLHLLIPKMRIT